MIFFPVPESGELVHFLKALRAVGKFHVEAVVLSGTVATRDLSVSLFHEIGLLEGGRP
jgi:hypothetical protein